MYEIKVLKNFTLFHIHMMSRKLSKSSITFMAIRPDLCRHGLLKYPLILTYAIYSRFF